jgi:hypothetical protein
MHEDVFMDGGIHMDGGHTDGDEALALLFDK